MNFWIRSQNKKRLISNPNLYISTSKDGDSYIGDTMIGHIGKYKNEERAIEVLNDINNIKFYKYMASLDINIFTKLIQEKYSPMEQQVLFAQMNTYEMPQE